MSEIRVTAEMGPTLGWRSAPVGQASGPPRKTLLGEIGGGGNHGQAQGLSKGLDTSGRLPGEVVGPWPR
jgi:hypothetical protein